MDVLSRLGGRRLALAGVAALAVLAGSVTAFSVAGAAGATILYASPTGAGTTCSASAPCSLTGAQTAVRSLVGSMSSDIVVQLAGAATAAWFLQAVIGVSARPRRRRSRPRPLRCSDSSTS